MINQPEISSYLAEEAAQERELVRLFRSEDELTIFDVGACEGEDSVRYARRFRNARIFAFEPLPANQELVRANFEKFQIENAELHCVALSDRQGRAEFHVSTGTPETLFLGPDWNYGNKSSSLLAPATSEPMHGWLRFQEVTNVECETLDSFCAARGIRRIDFLHLDVQGAESLVFAGGSAMMRKIVAVWLEVSDQELYRGQRLRLEIEQLMKSRGFALTMETRLEVEGDQFYVNLRFGRVWGYLLVGRLSKYARKLRRQVGVWKRALWKSFR